MININDNFGFYSVLTSPKRGYDYVTSLLVEYEVRFVQLREKKLSKYEILKIAEQMRKITENTNTLFIVNDDVQITLDCAADGVHLGQDDMSIMEARAILGDDKIIGLSTHNIEQTTKSIDLPINYIGVGPVWTTPTKDIPDPVLGLETMKKMVDISKVPAVCIGGISLDRVSGVFEAGGRNFSLVRPICDTTDPKTFLIKIKEIEKKYLHS